MFTGKRNQKSISNLYCSLDSKFDDVPVLKLQNFEKIESKRSDSFRIYCSQNPGDFSELNYRKGLANTLEDRFVLVSNTIDIHDKRNKNNPMVTMIIAGNVPSCEYNKENVQGMKTIQANMLMDENDDIWSVVGEDGDQRIVKKTMDDLDDILSSRLSNQVVTSSVNYEDNLNFENGDYIWFYDPDLYEVRSGYGINIKGSIVTLDRINRKPKNINKNQIIEIVSGLDENYTLGIPKHQVNSRLSTDMGEEILKYMRELYRDTGFYNKLDDLINKRRSIGEQGNSDSTGKGVVYK